MKKIIITRYLDNDKNTALNHHTITVHHNKIINLGGRLTAFSKSGRRYTMIYISNTTATVVYQLATQAEKCCIEKHYSN